MDRDVALWQRQVQDDQQELGLACYLFEASTAAFSALLNVLSANPAKLDSASYAVLRNEFRKYYMWNEGFSTRSGGLDHVLSGSRNLKATVLRLMAQWARAVCRVPKVFQDFDWSLALPKLVELEVLADKASQVSQATAVEIRSQFAVISTSLGSGSGSDSDFDSDSGSISSGIAFDDVAEDLKTYIENLNDLSSSLEYPATDIILIEESSIVVTEDISSMPEPIRPYFRIIRDRFPSTEAALVRKLGEANWQRRERLKLQLASRPMTDSFDSNSDDDSSVANTVRDTNSQPKDTHRPSIDLSITHESVTHESITTVSELSEPSLFDNNSAMFSRRQYSSDAESITSFATSIADGSEHGQRKIPKLAENHDFEAVFQCQICGEMLRSIRNRADWNKHVYGDLQPYICLFTECNLGLQTFQSRRDWIDHEFQIHRVNSQWCCNLCREDFGMQEVFRAHIEDIHQNEFVPSQIEEFVGASKRFVSRDGRDEKCPFCLTISSQTRKSFAGHVGRHLQEISLAALPLLEDSPDDKSDSESYGDDDGNNGDDDDGNNSDDGNDSDDDDGNNSDDGRDKEDDVPVVPVGEGKTINQLDSHKDSSSTDINDTEEIPSCVGNIEGDSVPPNTKSEPGLPTSKIEKGLAEHISALKILWTTLQQWTKHQATATQVSDAYVKVEFGFNIMCQNLTAAEIDVSDFDNAPELLRQVLEEALGQGASAENVNVCLSLFREIYIPLLNGLKRKCEIAKQKNLSQRKEVYEEARQGLRQTPETSVFEDAEWRALYRQIEREQTSLLNEIYAEESTSISPDEATGSQLGSGKIVQANRDFEADLEDELSLKKGDLIELIERDDEHNDGWYFGRQLRSLKTGRFPQVFVIDAPEDIAFPRSILKNRRPSEPMQTEAKFAMKSIRKTANSRSEPQAMIGTLIATINSARNVRRGTSTGKQEPYCVVRLGQERQTTDKDRRGEQTPQWDQELRFTVRDPPDEYQMTVSVINDDKIPQLIGDTLVNLRQVLVPGGGQSDFWYKLQYRGKYAGEIRIMIIYDDSMGQSVPDQEIDRAHDPVTRPTGPEPAAKQVPLQASSRRTTTSSEERLSTAIFERARGKSGASPPSDTVAAIKLVVAGDSKLKTKLLVTYTKGSFPSVYVPTVFENYSTIVTINNKQYTLDLWDTTGQEDYDRLRPLSYIESDVSLVCATLGIHEEYKSARDKWAPELKHFCAGNPIILLGIKNPDGDGEAEPGKITELGDDLEYGRDIAKEIGAIMYLECDLLTGKGLKETFDQAILAALESQRRKTRSSRWRQALFGKKEQD